MRFRGSLIALAILAALGAYLYLVEFPRQEKKEEAGKKEKQVFSFSRDDVVRLTLRRKGEVEIVVSRLEGENSPWAWKMEAPVETYADRGRVEDILRDMESLRKNRDIEGTGLAAYGLEPPDAVAVAELRGGGSVSLALGADTPVESLTYARAGEEGVILVDRHMRAALSKDALALRDRRAAAFESSRVQRVEIRAPKGRVVVKKEGGAWHVAEPSGTPAEKERMDNFLYALETMNASAVLAESAGDAERRRFGFGKPLFAVSVFEQRGDSQREAAAEFAGKGGNLYAVRGWDGALIEIENPRWEDLDPSFDALRRRKIFTFPKWEIKGVEVKNPEGGWSLAKENWEWTMQSPEKKAPDRVKADETVSAAARLAASGFSETCGAGEPFLEIRLRGEERSESAAFTRLPDGGICARVEGWDDAALLMEEPTLEAFLKPAAYLLEPTPPSELQMEDLHHH
jgi:hypothetical protein